jgi:hypothetical protein
MPPTSNLIDVRVAFSISNRGRQVREIGPNFLHTNEGNADKRSAMGGTVDTARRTRDRRCGALKLASHISSYRRCSSTHPKLPCIAV